MTDMPETHTAQPPFNDEDADVVLRTSDNVDFYIHKVILSIASPFFKDMFSLNQPQTTLDGPAALTQKNHPIIHITEDSQTIDHLLRLCYPVDDPASGDLNHIGRVLEAAMKYQLDMPTKRMKESLRQRMSEDSLMVFATACRLNLEEEAKAAARIWKQSPDPSRYSGPEMEQFSAGAYFRLLRYVRDGEETIFCDPPLSSERNEESIEITSDVLVETWPTANTDLILQSSDEHPVKFRVHRLILSFASGSRIIETPTSGNVENIPVITLSEDARTLAALLRLCYPQNAVTVDLELPSFSTSWSVVRAALKYDMQSVLPVATSQWMKHTSTHPLSVFFQAIRHGWRTEAEEAARCTIEVHPHLDHVYVPEIEFVTADVYQSLLRYHQECQQTLRSVCASFNVHHDAFNSAKSTSMRTGSRLTNIASLIAERELSRAYKAIKEASQRNNSFTGLEATMHPSVFSSSSRSAGVRSAWTSTSMNDPFTPFDRDAVIPASPSKTSKKSMPQISILVEESKELERKLQDALDSVKLS
ncbi:hypothetical protein C8Q75DRAFT_767559 [Abortiporus biennis]|nr:hypothetical protein C8Q75DRAFT_767559 [Abortiporus biennis]